MSVRILIGDVREKLAELADESVHCVVTSPPYWGLRDYGVAGQIGLEADFRDYVETMTAVFREVRRVLRGDGTLWLNLGDCYAGSWGAQSRGGPPSDKSTLRGNGHVGGGPKIKGLSATQIAAHPKGTMTGSASRTPTLKAKDLVGMPWRIAFALQADGWWLRSDIIWHKPNPMPESVTDRPTSAHEHVFLLAKSATYYFDAEAVREEAGEAHGKGYRKDASAAFQGNPPTNLAGCGVAEDGRRNIRNVWTIATEPYSEAHFATFPPSLIEPCIKAGCPVGGLVLDPFGGAGTTGLVADRLKRDAVLIELNPSYADLARNRIREDAGMFGEVA